MRDDLDRIGGERAPELEFSDIHRIEAAEGYHMLGQYKEAADEIASIPPERREHPKALHVGCRVHWALRQIPEAMNYAERFVRAAPNDPFGYVFMAMLLSHSNKHREAYELLKIAVPRFPAHATMHYDLARAAAECGLWPQARDALYRAICCQSFLKEVALDMPVFAPIRNEIEAMQPGN